MTSLSSDQPKLLVLCQLFYPELVSTGQTLTELCEELASMGVDVEVVCGRPTYPPTYSGGKKAPARMEHKGIKIRRLWGTGFPKLNLVGRIINQLTYAASVFLYLMFDRSRRTILVLTNPPFLGAICALQRRKPYIYLVFDVYPDTAVKQGLIKKGGWAERLWDLSNRISFARASAVVAIGRCMRDVLAKKINGDKDIHTIHVWCDDRNIRPVPAGANPLIEGWGLGGKFVLGYSGNCGRFHDMETIMEAARKLKDYEDIVFLFIGDGHKKAWMTAFAGKWKLDNCRFFPYVERSRLAYSLSLASVGLVSLSEGHEGLSVPSKTFGLMAAGVPVVAVMSEKSEIARVVRERGCGVVVRPGDPDGLRDAILGLYHGREKLGEMSENAREAVKGTYSLRSAAESYYKLLTSIGNS